MPIENPPPSSLADRLRALKEKQALLLQTTTNANNNNNIQRAQTSGIEALVCSLLTTLRNLNIWKLIKPYFFKGYSE
jgi:hypothetical protein